jgi:hypothetical protein
MFHTNVTRIATARRHQAAALFFFIILLQIVLNGCVSLADSPSGSNPYGSSGDLRKFIATAPLNGQPVFLGVSPNLQYQDDEKDAAVAAASVQAARYIELSGRIALRSSRDGGFTLLREDFQISENEDLAAALIGDIRVLDELVYDGGTLLRCLVEGVPSISQIKYTFRDSVGRPVWLEKVPEIDGYLVGVGTAARNRILGDSLEEADKSALSELLYQLSLLIQSDSGERVLGGYGTIAIIDNYQIAEGTLRSYYVLDRWMSDDGKTFYSFAVCPL